QNSSTCAVPAQLERQGSPRRSGPTKVRLAALCKTEAQWRATHRRSGAERPSPACRISPSSNAGLGRDLPVSRSQKESTCSRRARGVWFWRPRMSTATGWPARSKSRNRYWPRNPVAPVNKTYMRSTLSWKTLGDRLAGIDLEFPHEPFAHEETQEGAPAPQAGHHGHQVGSRATLRFVVQRAQRDPLEAALDGMFNGCVDQVRVGLDLEGTLVVETAVTL